MIGAISTNRRWLLGIAWLLVCLRAVDASAGPVVVNESFSPVLWGPSAAPSDYLQYGLQIDSGASPTLEYLNVVGADGSWLVRNMAVGVQNGVQDVVMNVGLNDFHAGVAYQTILTTDAQSTAPTFNSGTVRLLSAPVNYMGNDGFGITDFGEFKPPGPYVPPKPPKPLVDPPPPAIFIYRNDMPSLIQGPNQCVPTAFAMSTSWLIKRNGLKGTSDPDTIRDALIQFMKTDPAEGTTIGAAANGIEKYDSDKHLPIEIGQIDNSGSGYVANLLQALENGDDVEFLFKWLLSTGGHAVTIVGALNTTPVAYMKGEDQSATVWFIDPGDGKVHEDSITVTTTNGVVSVYISGYGTYLSVAVDEQVTPEPPTVILPLVGLAIYSLRRVRARNTRQLRLNKRELAANIPCPPRTANY